MNKLVELNSDELQEVNGGLAWLIPVIGAILVDSIINYDTSWESLSSGYSAGYAAAK